MSNTNMTKTENKKKQKRLGKMRDMAVQTTDEGEVMNESNNCTSLPEKSSDKQSMSLPDEPLKGIDTKHVQDPHAAVSDITTDSSQSVSSEDSSTEMEIEIPRSILPKDLTLKLKKYVPEVGNIVRKVHPATSTTSGSVPKDQIDEVPVAIDAMPPSVIYTQNKKDDIKDTSTTSVHHRNLLIKPALRKTKPRPRKVCTFPGSRLVNSEKLQEEISNKSSVTQNEDAKNRPTSVSAHGGSSPHPENEGDCSSTGSHVTCSSTGSHATVVAGDKMSCSEISKFSYLDDGQVSGPNLHNLESGIVFAKLVPQESEWKDQLDSEKDNSFPNLFGKRADRNSLSKSGHLKVSKSLTKKKRKKLSVKNRKKKLEKKLSYSFGTSTSDDSAERCVNILNNTATHTKMRMGFPDKEFESLQIVVREPVVLVDENEQVTDRTVILNSLETPGNITLIPTTDISQSKKLSTPEDIGIKNEEKLFDDKPNYSFDSTKTSVHAEPAFVSNHALSKNIKNSNSDISLGHEDVADDFSKMSPSNSVGLPENDSTAPPKQSKQYDNDVNCEATKSIIIDKLNLEFGKHTKSEDSVKTDSSLSIPNKSVVDSFFDIMDSGTFKSQNLKKDVRKSQKKNLSLCKKKLLDKNASQLKSDVGKNKTKACSSSLSPKPLDEFISHSSLTINFLEDYKTNDGNENVKSRQIELSEWEYQGNIDLFASKPLVTVPLPEESSADSDFKMVSHKPVRFSKSKTWRKGTRSLPHRKCARKSKNEMQINSSEMSITNKEDTHSSSSEINVIKEDTDSSASDEIISHSNFISAFNNMFKINRKRQLPMVEEDHFGLPLGNRRLSYSTSSDSELQKDNSDCLAKCTTDLSELDVKIEQIENGGIGSDNTHTELPVVSNDADISKTEIVDEASSASKDMSKYNKNFATEVVKGNSSDLGNCSKTLKKPKFKKLRTYTTSFVNMKTKARKSKTLKMTKHKQKLEYQKSKRLKGQSPIHKSRSAKQSFINTHMQYLKTLAGVKDMLFHGENFDFKKPSKKDTDKTETVAIKKRVIKCGENEVKNETPDIESVGDLTASNSADFTVANETHIQDGENVGNQQGSATFNVSNENLLEQKSGTIYQEYDSGYSTSSAEVSSADLSLSGLDISVTKVSGDEKNMIDSVVRVLLLKSAKFRRTKSLKRLVSRRKIKILQSLKKLKVLFSRRRENYLWCNPETKLFPRTLTPKPVVMKNKVVTKDTKFIPIPVTSRKNIVTKGMCKYFPTRLKTKKRTFSKRKGKCLQTKSKMVTKAMQKYIPSRINSNIQISTKGMQKYYPSSVSSKNKILTKAMQKYFSSPVNSTNDFVTKGMQKYFPSRIRSRISKVSASIHQTGQLNYFSASQNDKYETQQKSAISRAQQDINCDHRHVEVPDGFMLSAEFGKYENLLITTVASEGFQKSGAKEKVTPERTRINDNRTYKKLMPMNKNVRKVQFKSLLGDNHKSEYVSNTLMPKAEYSGKDGKEKETNLQSLECVHGTSVLVDVHSSHFENEEDMMEMNWQDSVGKENPLQLSDCHENKQVLSNEMTGDSESFGCASTFQRDGEPLKVTYDQCQNQILESMDDSNREDMSRKIKREIITKFDEITAKRLRSEDSLLRGFGGWEESLRQKPPKTQHFQVNPVKDRKSYNKSPTIGKGEINSLKNGDGVSRKQMKDFIVTDGSKESSENEEETLYLTSTNNEKEKDIGRLVWAKLGRERWWPGVTIVGSLVGLRSADIGKHWVFWLGDHKISQIPEEKIIPFVANYSKNVGKKMGKMFHKGILEAIQICSARCGKSSTNDQMSDNDLFTWANDGFCIPVDHTADLLRSPFDPQEGDPLPGFIIDKLSKIAENIQDSHSDDEVDGAKCRARDERDSGVELVKLKEREIDDICISCDDGNKSIVTPHPLFHGGLCKICKEDLIETLCAIGDDGSSVYCVICGYGGELFVCDDQDCNRAYCMECIEVFISEDAISTIRKTSPWLCFLCSPYNESTHGLIHPQKDWQQQIIKFFDTGYRVLEPDLSYLNTGDKKPIRVLSLFDGIGTGKVILSELGLDVDQYYSSEIDEDALLITTVHHGDTVKQLGDVVNLTESELKKICPIDLVMGGSPCNDLSLANPARKGFESGGTGTLFFDFYRILKIVQSLSADRHVFWMYENVASMKHEYRAVISRFLGCDPALWDAKYFSAQTRPRYFWGNIPGMYSTPQLSQIKKSVNLEVMLSPHCNRKAMVDRLRTVTTRQNSLRFGKNDERFPISMNGKDDIIWISELERVFGFPAHYTDVGNLPMTRRQKLLGKSWSIPVVKQILSPLKQYFSCTQDKSSNNKELDTS